MLHCAFLAARSFLPLRTSRRAPRKGGILVLSALLVVGICGFVAFSVDVGYIAAERAKLQATADAAATAAVHELASETRLEAVAQQYVTLNHPAANQLQVTTEAGFWDQDTHTFTPATYLSTTNAVRVSLLREDTKLFFAPVIGTSSVDITASSIALVQGGDCFGKGIIAADKVVMGQDVRLDNYCVYGRNGVSMGQDPRVTNGAKVGALSASTVTYGQDPVGLPENIEEVDKQPPLANQITNIIDDLYNGVNLPPQITNVQYFPSARRLPNKLVPGTAYVFNKSISIHQDYRVSDVIIATYKSISWGQDGKIRNSAGPTGDNYAIGLYAGENVSLGQDAVADGVNIVGGKDVTLGQDVRAFSGTIQSGRKVTVGQDPHLGGGNWLDAMPQESQGRSFLVQ